MFRVADNPQNYIYVGRFAAEKIDGEPESLQYHVVDLIVSLRVWKLEHVKTHLHDLCLFKNVSYIQFFTFTARFPYISE